MTLRSFSRVVALFFLAVLLTGAGKASAQFIQRNIYDANANAHADIQQALATARREHKRVILDFGGNWCGDCIVLNYYFHQSPNATLLARNFVLVDIDIGQYDHNLDVARQYEIPLKLGVPALAVLSPSGRLLYSQRNGEFEKMQRMDPSSVTSFLDRWKPAS
jgi:thiol:disulfide interchange protein